MKLNTKKMVDKHHLKNDFYATSYFLKTKKILEKNNINKIATLQFKSFCSEPYMLCGVSEVLEIIKTKLSKQALRQIKVFYYEDGTIIKPNTCVLSIDGPYKLVCCLENIIDGILARRSSVATNCWKVSKVFDLKNIIFMADRSDDYHLMPYDGYSAYVAGIRKFSNQAHIDFINDKQCLVVGTIPHSLIQQFDGDIVKTFDAYKNYYSDDITMLTDYHNDNIAELKRLTPFFKDIKAIRIDTSNNMIDVSLQSKKNNPNDYGSSHKLICLVRKYLDTHQGKHIKIICSSGNNLEKITQFKKQKTPVDMYGIGSSLIKLNLHFTADLVRSDSKLEAKQGRSYLLTKGMKQWKI